MTHSRNTLASRAISIMVLLFTIYYVPAMFSPARANDTVNAAGDHMSGLYQNQSTWKEIQTFLPESMRFNEGFAPKEEFWSWRGHRVHLDRFERPDAKLKIILLHGVGTNGRQMSLIVGGPMWKRGYETVAVDLPGYGMTTVAPDAKVTYDDWVQLVSDLIDAERARDGRPVVLYGLSAGGMLAYHATALNKKVAGIIGMTFLDQREQSVRDATAYNWLMSRAGGPMASLTARTPFAGIKLPMRVVSKMYTLVNNEDALKVFLNDASSAGNWVSMRFLDSYMNYVPAVEPEDFSVCPILLAQPDKDAWTPFALSDIFLKRISKVKKTVVMLENAGHYPLEQPGLKQLEEAMAVFIDGLGR